MSIHPAALPYLYIYFTVFPPTPTTEAVLFHGFPKLCLYPLKECCATRLPMPEVPTKLRVTPAEGLPQECRWRRHPLRSLLCSLPGVPRSARCPHGAQAREAAVPAGTRARLRAVSASVSRNNWFWQVQSESVGIALMIHAAATNWRVNKPTVKPRALLLLLRNCSLKKHVFLFVFFSVKTKMLLFVIWIRPFKEGLTQIRSTASTWRLSLCAVLSAARRSASGTQVDVELPTHAAEPARCLVAHAETSSLA